MTVVVEVSLVVSSCTLPVRALTPVLRDALLYRYLSRCHTLQPHQSNATDQNQKRAS